MRTIRHANWLWISDGFPSCRPRFDKLDVMFLAFLHFALIVEALRFDTLR